MAAEKDEALRNEALQDEALEAATGGDALVIYSRSRHCIECGGKMLLRENENIIDSLINGSNVWYCTKCGRTVVVHSGEDEGGYHTTYDIF